MFVTPAHVLRVVGQWPVSSQQVARRNALVASTALADRRRELVEVEEFLTALAARSATPAVLEVQVGAGRSKGA